jgi:Cu(I)/Ag(I) efflux system membrane fusion protein
MLRTLILAGVAVVVMGGTFYSIGAAQRAGWIAKPEFKSESITMSESGVRYICPMMCVPPTEAPGRCPVCEMELVPAETGPVFIDPATRRILDIQTFRVQPVALDSSANTRIIQSVGELTYDEGNLKTISAYVDGRIEKLQANYTGIEVSQGDPLAVIYSPPLFVAQKELLVAKRSLARAANSNPNPNEGLYASSRQRLIELGMTDTQIDQLEESGEANSRLELVAPMSGTVIEKLAVEGQYISQGEAVYRLANLTQVWLMLKLFPEDAALVKIGDLATATIDSLPGKQVEGKVEFVFPNIDPVSRTVSVRVALPNPDGLLRIGDYVRASIPISMSMLANPSVGMGTHTDSISSTQSTSGAPREVFVVPRDAVLLVGPSSVVYVESEPGRFEMRKVVVGSISQREVTILEGLAAGESIARKGNFLIDSQMQLAGNPSLIDPSRAEPKKFVDEMTPEMEEAFAELAPEDRELAMKQRQCAVADMPLGSMGVPIRVEVSGQVVFLCCEGCRNALMNNPQKYLSKLAEQQ